MNRPLSPLLFALLFALTLAALYLSARTTLEFAASIDRPQVPAFQNPPATPAARLTPSPTPRATGALSRSVGKRSS